MINPICLNYESSNLYLSRLSDTCEAVPNASKLVFNISTVVLSRATPGCYLMYDNGHPSLLVTYLKKL